MGKKRRRFPCRPKPKPSPAKNIPAAPPSADGVNQIFTDPETGIHMYKDLSGTIFEWSEEKRAWFPKIDDEFLASYYEQNYDYQAKPASNPQPEPPGLAPDSDEEKEEEKKANDEEKTEDKPETEEGEIIEEEEPKKKDENTVIQEVEEEILEDDGEGEIPLLEKLDENSKIYQWYPQTGKLLQKQMTPWLKPSLLPTPKDFKLRKCVKQTSYQFYNLFHRLYFKRQTKLTTIEGTNPEGLPPELLNILEKKLGEKLDIEKKTETVVDVQVAPLVVPPLPGLQSAEPTAHPATPIANPNPGLSNDGAVIQKGFVANTLKESMLAPVRHKSSLLKSYSDDISVSQSEELDPYSLFYKTFIENAEEIPLDKVTAKALPSGKTIEEYTWEDYCKFYQFYYDQQPPDSEQEYFFIHGCLSLDSQYVRFFYSHYYTEDDILEAHAQFDKEAAVKWKERKEARDAEKSKKDKIEEIKKSSTVKITTKTKLNAEEIIKAKIREKLKPSASEAQTTEENVTESDKPAEKEDDNVEGGKVCFEIAKKDTKTNDNIESVVSEVNKSLPVVGKKRTKTVKPSVKTGVSETSEHSVTGSAEAGNSSNTEINNTANSTESRADEVIEQKENSEGNEKKGSEDKNDDSSVIVISSDRKSVSPIDQSVEIANSSKGMEIPVQSDLNVVSENISEADAADSDKLVSNVVKLDVISNKAKNSSEVESKEHAVVLGSSKSNDVEFGSMAAMEEVAQNLEIKNDDTNQDQDDSDCWSDCSVATDTGNNDNDKLEISETNSKNGDKNEITKENSEVATKGDDNTLEDNVTAGPSSDDKIADPVDPADPFKLPDWFVLDSVPTGKDPDTLIKEKVEAIAEKRVKQQLSWLFEQGMSSTAGAGSYAGLNETDIEQLAVFELQKEAKRRQVDSIAMGVAAWTRPAIHPNKRFLSNMLVSTLRDPIRRGRNSRRGYKNVGDRDKDKKHDETHDKKHKKRKRNRWSSTDSDGDESDSKDSKMSKLDKQLKDRLERQRNDRSREENSSYSPKFYTRDSRPWLQTQNRSQGRWTRGRANSYIPFHKARESGQNFWADAREYSKIDWEGKKVKRHKQSSKKGSRKKSKNKKDKKHKKSKKKKKVESESEEDESVVVVSSSEGEDLYITTSKKRKSKKHSKKSKKKRKHSESEADEEEDDESKDSSEDSNSEEEDNEEDDEEEEEGEEGSDNDLFNNDDDEEVDDCLEEGEEGELVDSDDELKDSEDEIDEIDTESDNHSVASSSDSIRSDNKQHVRHSNSHERTSSKKGKKSKHHKSKSSDTHRKHKHKRKNSSEEKKSSKLSPSPERKKSKKHKSHKSRHS